MKKLAISLFGASLLGSSAFAVIYNDAINDVNMPGGYFINQDISSVEITNDATSITFKINVAGGVPSSNWGKYAIMIDSVAGGDMTSNGWGRSVGMASGMDIWLPSYIDSDNKNQLWTYSGGWSTMGANDVSNTVGANSIEFTRSLSSLGLSIGSTFLFDAMTTGGGGNDSAWDLLSKSVVNDSDNDGVTGWSENTTSTSQLSYTVVPEPGSFLALGLGALALMRRKK
jgi:hypothetical protein